MAKTRQELVGNGSLSARQEKALVALLTCPTHEMAAKQAEVAARTLRDYLRQPAFRAEYLRPRAELVSSAIALCQQRAPAAVTVLSSIMTDASNPPSVRVSAASKLVDVAMKGVETEDLAEQVAELQEGIDSLKTLVQLLPPPPVEQPANGHKRRV